MSDLKEPQLAYFLGLCVGRGSVLNSSMVIEFNYKTDSFKLPPGHSIDLSKKKREYALEGSQTIEFLRQYFRTEVEKNQNEHKYSINVKLPSGSLISQILTRYLGQLNQFSYKTTCLPNAIWNASSDIQKHFIRGLADCCSAPTYSDHDAGNRTRICIDIPFENWKLPIEICKLLQENLSIPVNEILWGHPNLRTSSKPESSSWAKEHRLRIFSTEFCKIDFGFEFKKDILKRFIEYDGDRKPKTFCWPNKTYRKRTRLHHRDENNEKIPIKARKHICNFREICLAMECTQKER